MIAFTFPGQGSQKPGMGEAWIDHPSWELVAEASDAADRDIAHLLLHADADELKATQNAQIATFVTSLIALDAVERLGAAPARLAGHSLGEYTALAAGGALSFAEGVRLVAERGDAMRLAGEEQEGTMAAVLGLDDDQVDIACNKTDGDVWVANYNAPGQVVIAGRPDAVDAAGAAAKELGAKRVMALAVSGAFHTPLMTPARDRLRKAIADADIRALETPVIANVDATAHTEPNDWTSLLAAQLTSPVRWRQCLHQMLEDGITTFVELGPGTVLTGMAKRTAKGCRNVSVQTPGDLDTLLETISSSPASEVAPLEGEHLFATERLVVSPAAGIFQPEPEVTNGAELRTGDCVGIVGEHEVRSPFSGALMGLLAMTGERVSRNQPIAWLRTA